MKSTARHGLHVLAYAILVASCDGPLSDEDAVGTDDQTSTEEDVSSTSSGIIFPDDSGPGGSCQQNVPLTCGSTPYSLTYYSNILTSARSTVTISRAGNASISSNAQNISCTATSGFSVGGIEYLGAVNITKEPYIEDTGKSVVFQEKVYAPQIRPTGTGTPSPTTRICAIPCDPSAPIPPGCSASGFPTRALVGQVSVNGGAARNVTMTGIVDYIKYNATDKTLRVFCRFSVPGNQLTTSRTRPNDVIAAGGNRFVRGYELTGQARYNACLNIATKACTSTSQPRWDGVNESCITPRTNECVASFSRPDPCASTCTACTSNASCGGGRWACEGGCCVYNPA